MDNRKRLLMLSRAIEARQSDRGYNIVVALPVGHERERRPPGVYAEGSGSLRVLYEGAEPDAKLMQALAAKMSPGGVTIICEPNEDLSLLRSGA